MRVLLDANVLLDCLVLESTGLPRSGKAASDQVLTLCDSGIHHGIVAWHTLPIIAHYYRKQNTAHDTGAMMDALLAMLEVPTVAHSDAAGWRMVGITDFEDALQTTSAIAGGASVIITRNTGDFAGSPLPAMTPEEFLAAYP